MASNVKRFINGLGIKILLFAFVGLSAHNVNAQMIRDEVISLEPPFSLTLKKSGAVRLAGLLYEDRNDLLAQYLKTGDRVRVDILSPKPDRYGRKAAHVYLMDNRWLQGELVRNQQAIPYPYPDESDKIRDLYQLEKPNVISALEPSIPRDQFSIIEGTIIEVADIKNTIYLNFGSNWRDDFTVMLNKKSQKMFKTMGFDLPILKGRKVRIRGWVFEKNGPMIAPEHPSQLQILD